MRAPHFHRVRGLVWLIVALLLSAPLAGAQFWTKKPYHQWSKDEAQTMLSDSPWAREIVLANISGLGRLTSSRSTGNEQTGAELTYQVQVRSAQPVRQAIVQLGRLSPRYQQMSAEQKARVDQNGEQFANAKSDEIVFWVNYRSSVQGQNLDLVQYWQKQTLATLANTLWLMVPDREKVEATYFAPGPEQSFEVRFPRPKELPADGTMVMQFTHPDGLAGQKGQTVRAEFKLKKLIVNGAAVY